MRCWSAETRSEEGTNRLGKQLGELAAAGMVVLLSGPLGAGKTCFARGVARGLGVPESIPVTSPSYTLLNIHRGRLDLYHFDLYRLSRVDDLEDLGYDECAEGEGLTLVEWADRLRDPLPASLAVEITRRNDDVRMLSFTARDEIGERVLAGMRNGWEALATTENL